MTGLLADPWFYAAALPAVILVGLSKGGFGGAVGFVGVPLMALVMPPVQAAAILLPILVLMDIVSVWTWRGVFDASGAEDHDAGRDDRHCDRLADGRHCHRRHGAADCRRWSRWSSSCAGPISRSATAAGTLPLPTGSRRCSGARSPASPVSSPMSAGRRSRSTPCRSGSTPRSLSGTAAIFFAVTNAVKLVPYFALGQFDAANLTASAVLMPIAPLATLAGAWLVRRMRPEIFYPFTYGTVALIACKLIYDGVLDILG